MYPNPKIILHYWDNHRVPKSEKKNYYPDKDCVLKSEDIITLSRSVHILIYYYITETNTQCPYSNPEIYLHNGENHRCQNPSISLNYQDKNGVLKSEDITYLNKTMTNRKRTKGQTLI